MATHRSIRSASLGPDSLIHLGTCRASAASSRAITSSSTVAVRLTIVIIIRKSIAPVANTAATAGSLSRNARAYPISPEARPRPMFSAADTSAATSSHGSVRHKLQSANSRARRASNTPIATSRRAHAAFSSRADDVIASTRSASASPSNMCSTLLASTDIGDDEAQACGSSSDCDRCGCAVARSRFRTKVCLLTAVAAGMPVYALGASLVWRAITDRA